MRQNIKKAIAKYEDRIGVENVPSGAIVIYNPKFPNFDRKSIKAKYVIVLPDNHMDESLTQSIGNTFTVL